MLRVAIAIIVVALWIYAIIDCIRTPRSSMPGKLAKPVWIVLTIVPVIGSLLWLIMSWPIKHADLGGTFSLGRSKPRQQPVAPDDDPEFLARLDAQNRFHEWERKHEGTTPNGPDDTTTGSTPSA